MVLKFSTESKRNTMKVGCGGGEFYINLKSRFSVVSFHLGGGAVKPLGYDYRSMSGPQWEIQDFPGGVTNLEAH